MTQVYGKRGWVGGNPPTVPFKLNECSPQARGLIGWWPALGSRGGNVWYDLSGRGINLAKASTPADISVDTLGWAKHFTADGQYYGTLNAGLAANPGARLTVAAWARTSTSAAGLSTIVHKNRTTTADWSYILRRSGNVLHWRIQTSTGALNTDVVGVFADNGWKHCVGTWNGASLITYVNGVTAGSTGGTGTVAPGTETVLRIGGKADSLYSWLGDIAEVRIYNWALSAAEVWQLYAPQTRFDLYAPIQRFWPGVTLGSPWYQQLQQRVS